MYTFLPFYDTERVLVGPSDPGREKGGMEVNKNTAITGRPGQSSHSVSTEVTDVE